MKWKMANRKWQIQCGYTLVEILVGLTIIGLVFGVGYVNFRDFARRQAVAGAGKNLQGDLRLAQQKALSGEKPDDIKCTGSNTLIGYSVKIVTSSEYKIYATCSGGDATNPAKDVNLPTGISISTPSPNPILFKVLGSGTNIPEGTSAVLTLTQSRTNNTFRLTMGAGGEIQ